jgi:hypothetical protein
MVSMLACQLFLFCLCRASERSRHSDSKVDEVLILDKRPQYFLMLMTDLKSNMEINCAHIDFSKNNFAFESYLDLDNFNRNIWIRFRISAHNLEIEKGRHHNIQFSSSFC